MMDAKTPPHPALVLFFIGGGLIATVLGAVLLYFEIHAAGDAPDHLPVFSLLGVLLVLAGIGALAQGVRASRHGRSAD